MGLLCLTSHNTVEIPEDFEFLGDNRVRAKDFAPCEVCFQSLKYDNVGGEDQEGLCVLLASFLDFSYRVEELPCHGQRHDLSLSASGRHLDAIPGEFVIWW